MSIVSHVWIYFRFVRYATSTPRVNRSAALAVSIAGSARPSVRRRTGRSTSTRARLLTRSLSPRLPRKRNFECFDSFWGKAKVCEYYHAILDEDNRNTATPGPSPANPCRRPGPAPRPHPRLFIRLWRSLCVAIAKMSGLPGPDQISAVMGQLFNQEQDNEAVQKASNYLRTYVRMPVAVPVLFEILVRSPNPPVRYFFDFKPIKGQGGQCSSFSLGVSLLRPSPSPSSPSSPPS